MTEQDIRKSIDLHHGRTDNSPNVNYVEFSFHACFYELFPGLNSYWKTKLDGSEIPDLMNALHIPIDKDLIIRKYLDQKNHDTEVFHSPEDEQVFAYFDLEKEPTDQNDMLFLGIRCKKTDEPVIHERLLGIYRKLNTTSPFSFDIHNHTLYYKVFRSYTYFYQNAYSKDKRQLNHH